MYISHKYNKVSNVIRFQKIVRLFSRTRAFATGLEPRLDVKIWHHDADGRWHNVSVQR